MTLALFPRLLDGLLQLPRMESGAKRGRNRLMLFGAIVMAQAIIGETQGLGEHPSLTIVLRKKVILSDVAQFVEWNVGQNPEPQFRRLTLLVSPKALGI